MPKSRRDKEISLTQVKKKTRKHKDKIISEIRDCVDKYLNVFVLSFDAMRSTKMAMIRQHFKNKARFFLGKNNVMAVALGRDPTTEKSDGLHKVSRLLIDQRGLMFTNEDVNSVLKYFENFSESDYARAGEVVKQNISLPAGPLPQFPFSVEPQLRKLGMPTKLEKGTVELVQDFQVCKEDYKLTPEQAKILKLLDLKLATFRAKVVGHWEVEFGLTLY